ncbi:DNA-directed RNA polymerase III, subunit Rpc31 [Auriculariales sp. MPI-PUGE-AT-0066]|nr:DNA-directed RNA polymerase III, subunit Rpc31 [Auriculariales sp. MPI-PUGE-AT-0066]
MSRGGRGGFGRGRGGFGGGFGGGGGSLLPLGLTPADLAAISKEQAVLYPPREPLPTLSDVTPAENEIATYQMQYVERMRRSAYYIVEEKKSTDLPRYSDKYKPEAYRPKLRKEDLNPAFFPPTVFNGYFDKTKKKDRKKRRKTETETTLGATEDDGKEKLTMKDVMDMADDDAGSGDEEAQSEKEKGSGGEEELADYTEDSDDNDYADNYFDNGEDDDDDNLGGPHGGGDDDGGYD